MTRPFSSCPYMFRGEILILSFIFLMVSCSSDMTPGYLVAADSTKVWKSPITKDGIYSMRPQVEYKLINKGRTTVHVTSLESGCGCTTPTISLTTIEPEGVATVTAVGTPLSSGMTTVPITIHTDSPQVPDIVLKFTMISNRLAPFIASISGDFAYLDDDIEANIPRILTVATVEANPSTQSPSIMSDLPFIRISAPAMQERPYDEGSLKQREYTYKVILGSPPEGSFSGKLWAVDPWNGAKSQELLIFHRAVPAIAVIPATVTITPENTDGSGTTEISILMKPGMPAPVIEMGEEESRILTVTETTPTNSGRIRRFSIRANPGKNSGIRTLTLLVKAPPKLLEPVIIPVCLRGAAK